MSESSFPADFKRKIENCYLSHGKHSFLQHMFFFWPRFKATVPFFLPKACGVAGVFTFLGVFTLLGVFDFLGDFFFFFLAPSFGCFFGVTWRPRAWASTCLSSIDKSKVKPASGL